VESEVGATGPGGVSQGKSFSVTALWNVPAAATSASLSACALTDASSAFNPSNNTDATCCSTSATLAAVNSRSPDGGTRAWISAGSKCSASAALSATFSFVAASISSACSSRSASMSARPRTPVMEQSAHLREAGEDAVDFVSLFQRFGVEGWMCGHGCHLEQDDAVSPHNSTVRRTFVLPPLNLLRRCCGDGHRGRLRTQARGGQVTLKVVVSAVSTLGEALQTALALALVLGLQAGRRSRMPRASKME
jgi:hypothetical protein